MIHAVFLATALTATMGPTPPPPDSSHVPRQPVLVNAPAKPVHHVATQPVKNETAPATPVSAWRRAYIAKHGHAPSAIAPGKLHTYKRCT